jgi:hypothetical protein
MDVQDLQPFSASSIATFMRCAKQWEYAYIYEFKRPPSLRMIIGTSAHAAEEVNFRGKLDTGLDLALDDVLDVFSDAFDSGVAEADRAPEDEKETKSQAKDSGIATLTVYHETVAPTIEPLWVEHEGLIHINDIPYSYTIDLVDTTGRVRDHKYTKRRPQGPGDYPYHWPVSAGGPVPERAEIAFAGILSMVQKAVEEEVFLPTGLTNHACSWCGYQSICKDYQNTK